MMFDAEEIVSEGRARKGTSRGLFSRPSKFSLPSNTFRAECLKGLISGERSQCETTISDLFCNEVNRLMGALFMNSKALMLK